MISAVAVLLTSVFALAILVAFYGVNAYGIYKLMQAEGLGDTYRAWIPVWNSFVLGEILEQETDGYKLTFPNTTKWIIPLYPFASFVPVIGSIATFAGWVYTIILSAVMAGKRNTTASMVISSLVGLPGIGYIIYASALSAADPNRKMQEKPPFAENPVHTSAQSVDFTVEAADDKSAPDGFKAGPVYAKPEGSRGTRVATPDNKMGTVEATPAGTTSFVESVEVNEEVKEFDVPLAEEADFVEFDVTEE